MGYRLRESVSFCTVGETVLFLDLKADRYFCLATRTNRAFLSVIRGQSLPNEDDGLAVLLRKELLIESPGDSLPTAPILPTPAHDLEVVRSTPLRKAAIAAACAHRLAALGRVRRHPLADTVGRLRYRRMDAVAQQADREEMAEISGAARAVDKLLRSQDRCLSRSLAIADHCAARGYFPSFVMGVRIPFAAHCWIQDGDCVLSEPVEKVADFKPILVV